MINTKKTIKKCLGKNFKKPSRELTTHKYKGFNIVPWVNSWYIVETKQQFRSLKQAKNAIDNKVA